MSHVTTVLLTSGSCGPQIDELNAGLQRLYQSRGGRDTPGHWNLRNLAKFGEAWGGSKYPTDLYGGGLNFLPINEFVALVVGLDWPDPEDFRLMLSFEEDDRWRVLTLADLRRAPWGDE